MNPKLGAMLFSFVMIGSATAGIVGAFDPTDPLDGARDADGDGLSNYNEFLRGTDPSNPDSDGGGATDGWEINYNLDPTSRYDDYIDTDGDGWDNYREFIVGTDPTNPDTDDDGTRDSVDPNPLFPDTPYDVAQGGFGSGQGGGDSPVDGTGTGSGSGSGSGQGSGSGSGSGTGSGQGQGQGNGQGQGAGQGAGQGNGNGQGSGQSPGDQGTPSDSDGDGIDDGTEDSNGNGQVDPGETDPMDRDTDRDGLNDRIERDYGTDPTNPDTDWDGLCDGSELGPARSDPLDKDTDNDGLWDSEETGWLTPSDRPGMLGPMRPSPDTFGRAGISWTRFAGTDPVNRDTDGDGTIDSIDDEDDDVLGNVFELRSTVVIDGFTFTNPNWGRSDPQEADTDCDFLLDGWEADPGTAPIGKTSGYPSNPADDDTDDDGLSDDVDPNPGVTTLLPPTRIGNVRVYNGLSTVQLDGVRSIFVVKQQTFTVFGDLEYQDSVGIWRPIEANKPMDVFVYLVQWNGTAFVAQKISTATQTGTGGFTASIRIVSDDIRAGPGYLFVQTDIHTRDPTSVYYARTMWTEPNAPAFAIPPLATCTPTA